MEVGIPRGLAGVPPSGSRGTLSPSPRILGALPLLQPTGRGDLRDQNGPSADPVPTVGIHVTMSQIPPSLSLIFFKQIFIASDFHVLDPEFTVMNK